jgi:hypothetical protein
MNGWLLTDCWHGAEMASVEYFNLVDLWEKYHKSSVYGGSCVADPRRTKVIQYYILVGHTAMHQ